jgi:hypothetical protein
MGRKMAWVGPAAKRVKEKTAQITGWVVCKLKDLT